MGVAAGFGAAVSSGIRLGASVDVGSGVGSGLGVGSGVAVGSGVGVGVGVGVAVGSAVGVGAVVASGVGVELDGSTVFCFPAKVNITMTAATTNRATAARDSFFFMVYAPYALSLKILNWSMTSWAIFSFSLSSSGRSISVLIAVS